jgi:hypothetical protein
MTLSINRAIIRPTPRHRQPGLGKLMKVSFDEDRCRRVVNSPKASSRWSVGFGLCRRAVPWLVGWCWLGVRKEPRLRWRPRWATAALGGRSRPKLISPTLGDDYFQFYVQPKYRHSRNHPILITKTEK